MIDRMMGTGIVFEKVMREKEQCRRVWKMT